MEHIKYLQTYIPRSRKILPDQKMYFRLEASFLEETNIQPRYLVSGENDKEKASRLKTEELLLSF